MSLKFFFPLTSAFDILSENTTSTVRNIQTLESHHMQLLKAWTALTEGGGKLAAADWKSSKEADVQQNNTTENQS